MRKSLAPLVLILTVSGCVKQMPLESTPQLNVVKGETELPAPVRSDLIAPDRPALIGPLDTITVEVFGVPELGRELQVDASGRIAMPLLGTLDAGGKTPGELAKDIQHELAGRYVRNPNVSVNIKSSVSQVVTIDGQVTDPGLYPVTKQMTLMRAIASARGLTEFAKTGDVVILRTVDGQRMAGLYNLEAIRRGRYADPPIYANDVVLVGESKARRMFKDIVSLAPLLAAPVVAFVQRN